MTVCVKHNKRSMTVREYRVFEVNTPKTYTRAAIFPPLAQRLQQSVMPRINSNDIIVVRNGPLRGNPASHGPEPLPKVGKHAHGWSATAKT